MSQVRLPGAEQVRGSQSLGGGSLQLSRNSLLVISKCEEGVGFRGKVIKRYNCSESPRSFNANGNYKGEGRFIGL